MKTWVTFICLVLSLSAQAQLYLNAAVVDLSCNANSGAPDGSIDIIVEGGVQPYNYSWSNGSTAEDISSLSAGTYEVVVTDSNGDTAMASFSLAEPAPMDIAEVIDDPDCNVLSGVLDGGIDITASGGTAPYSYNWSGTNVNIIVEDQYGLGSGTYSITITDANGCEVSASYTLKEPPAVEVSGVTNELDCNADNGPANGQIDLTVTGGQGASEGDYTYEWTTPDGSGVYQTDSDQYILSAGSYTVYVTDANGCTGKESFVVNQPNIIEIESEIDLPLCGTANGRITLEVSGGIGNYSYDWTTTNGNITSPGAARQYDLSPGTYSVTVTDDNGCTADESFDIIYANGTEVELKLNIASLCRDSEPMLLSGGLPLGGVYSGPGVVGGEFFPNSAGIGAHTITYSYTDADGCINQAFDIVKVNSEPFDDITDITVCEEELPYTWRAFELTESGSYNVELSQNGCNYNSILNLTIVNKTPDEITTLVISEQDLPFTWKGQQLSVSGTYFNPVTDSNGCSYDQILELTISSYVAHVQFYYDENQNGQKEAAEKYFSAGAIKVNQEKYYSNFRSEGIYLALDQGELSIEYDETLNPDWFTTSQKAFEFVVEGDSFQTAVEFGLSPYITDSELNSHLDNNRFRCGEEVDFVLSAINNGTAIETGAVYLELDYRIEDYSFTIPPTFEGNSIVGWEVDNLYPSEKLEIAFVVKAPLIMDPSQVGELYRFRHGLHADLSDAGDHEVELRCSYDPNDKQISPKREDDLALIAEPLNYKIRFQNTGNDYAKDVSIVDTLSEHLDLSTFRITNTSHPDELEVSINDGRTVVTFDFKNIFLPDSTTNEPLSNGFVSYTIAAKEDVEQEASIENTAYIYFDFNPAIITNTTKSIMVETFPVSRTESILQQSVKVYPNPAGNQINISTETAINLVVTNHLGQRVAIQQLEPGVNQLQTGEWQSGLYFLQFADAANNFTERVVIER